MRGDTYEKSQFWRSLESCVLAVLLINVCFLYCFLSSAQLAAGSCRRVHGRTGRLRRRHRRTPAAGGVAHLSRTPNADLTRIIIVVADTLVLIRGISVINVAFVVVFVSSPRRVDCQWRRRRRQCAKAGVGRGADSLRGFGRSHQWRRERL